MKIDKDTKRRIVKIILDCADCDATFDVCSIVGTLIEEGEWDARIEPKDAYIQVRDIVEALVPIIEYKANETDEGFIYSPYPFFKN